MKNLKNSGFSKIWIGIVIIVILIGGFFAWKYLIVPREVSFTRLTIDDDARSTTSVYAADLDNDGDQDILGIYGWSMEIAWWRNDGNEGFTKFIIDDGDDFGNLYFIHTTDLDNDDYQDILGVDVLDDKIIWWRNDGNGVFVKSIVGDNFSGAHDVYTVDLDGDGDQDVLGAAGFINTIAWWRNDGNGVFTKSIIDDNFDGAYNVYATDLDNDGDQDVLGAAIFANTIAWWRNNGNGVFTEYIIDDNFYKAGFVYATDLDNDGDQDVLGTTIDANKVAWWRNNGNGVFAESIIDIGDDFKSVCKVYTADLDNDGDQDVLGAALFANKVIWWRNNGNGVFTESIIDDAFNSVDSIYIVDLDSDNDQDILGIVADIIIDDIIWWRNDLIHSDWFFSYYK